MYTALLVLAIPAFFAVRSYRSWQRNLAAAKTSGLHCDSAPVFLGEAFWMASQIVLMPVFNLLPSYWTQNWIDIVEIIWPYRHKFTPFLKRNQDIVVCASPAGIYMSIADADAIAQICARRNDFTKPTEVYEMLDLFGTNIVTTENQRWRDHRKAVTPSFSERNHGLVWEETVRQVQGLLGMWAGREGNSGDDMTVRDCQDDAANLSLHVISKAGFGIPLFWPGEKVEISKDSGIAHFSDQTVSVKGVGQDGLQSHGMTFKDALITTLDKIIWFAAFSPSMLKKLPFRASGAAWDTWDELRRYFNELLANKIAEIRAGNTNKSTMDLMGSLVETTGIANPKTESSPLIPPQEVIGDAFVFMFAGHETTANSIHHSMLGLALNRPAQAALHDDLDAILPNADPASWIYVDLCDKLLNSMLGAVINEQFRLLTPVINIPKVVRTSAQILNLERGATLIPRGTFMHLNAYAVHRNPRYWPHGASQRTDKTNDLEDYVPQRWIVDAKGDGNAKKLFQPKRGSFMPFSDGSRGCLGRRFALVELAVVFAVVFQRYSVELDVSAWADDGQVDAMNKEERRAVYQKAIDAAYAKLDTGMESILTLKLKRGNEIPLRFVRRGKERFADV